MILRSRLFTREPVLVPVQALANMAHHSATEVKAPVGLPSITQQALADARMRLEGEEGAAIADAAPLLTDDQSRIELEVRTMGRALAVGSAAIAAAVPGPSHMLEHDEHEMRGHYEDVQRDHRHLRRLLRARRGSSWHCSSSTAVITELAPAEERAIAPPLSSLPLLFSRSLLPRSSVGREGLGMCVRGWEEWEGKGG